MSTIAKAIAALITTALASLAVVLVGDTSFGDLTDGQWVTVVATALGAALVVFTVPNAAPKP